MSIYEADRGYRLFQRTTFSPGVLKYVCAQTTILRKLLKSSDALIELGCGKGEHLNLAKTLGLAYLGVDPSEQYISEAKSKYKVLLSDNCQLVCARAEDYPEWASIQGSRYTRPLLFMPFNCLGNVDDPQTVLTMLSMQPLAFFLSIFTNSPLATQARAKYYRRAGFRALPKRTKWGVQFCDSNGLATTGFDMSVLLRAAKKCGLSDARSVRVSDTGAGLVGTKRRALHRL